MLDIGQSEDWIGLQVALAPCLLGYGAVARQLHAHPEVKRGEQNRYWAWIENYVAEDYTTAVKTGSGGLKRLCCNVMRVLFADLLHSQNY